MRARPRASKEDLVPLAAAGGGGGDPAEHAAATTPGVAIPSPRQLRYQAMTSSTRMPDTSIRGVAATVQRHGSPPCSAASSTTWQQPLPGEAVAIGGHMLTMRLAWKWASHAVDGAASAPAAERREASTATATKAWTRAIAYRLSWRGRGGVAAWREEERTGGQLLVAFVLWRKMKCPWQSRRLGSLLEFCRQRSTAERTWEAGNDGRAACWRPRCGPYSLFFFPSVSFPFFNPFPEYLYFVANFFGT